MDESKYEKEKKKNIIKLKLVFKRCFRQRYLQIYTTNFRKALRTMKEAMKRKNGRNNLR